MALSIAQTLTACAVNIQASFFATGGTSPYIYSVVDGGVGGTIDEITGIYLAPPSVNTDDGPIKSYDTILVMDMAGGSATTQILVGSPLLLFAEIIQNQMGLAADHIYLWDQKLFQPTDSSLYVALSVPRCKPFGSTNRFDANGNSVQVVNMLAQVDINAISRGPSARDRKEEIIAAVGSNYAESQQEINSFLIGKLPPNSQFVNLSQIDGAAIPYRYQITLQMQYAFTKTTAVPYFDQFEAATVATDP